MKRSLLVLSCGALLALTPALQPLAAQPGDSAQPAPAGRLIPVDTVNRPATEPTDAPLAPGEADAPEGLAQRFAWDRGFPPPLGGFVFWIALFGALGAFAADLVTDGGRIDRPGRAADGPRGYLLGFIGKLVVGSVAALVVITLNPPSTWLSLIGSALAAGLGGEAILLARTKAQEAEQERSKRVVTENQNRTARNILAQSVPAAGADDPQIAGAGEGLNFEREAAAARTTPMETTLRAAAAALAPPAAP